MQESIFIARVAEPWFPRPRKTTVQGLGPRALEFNWAIGDFGWCEGLASLVEFEVGGRGILRNFLNSAQTLLKDVPLFK